MKSFSKRLKRVVVIGLAVAYAVGPLQAAVIRSATPYVGVTQYQYIQQKGDTVSQPQFPREVVVNVLAIDTAASGVRFQMSPSNGSSPGEVTLQKPSTFANGIGAQIAINTGFYDTSNPYGANSYTDLSFITASNGDVYSKANGGEAMFNVSSGNAPKIGFAGTTGTATFKDGTTLYNATGGNQRILNGGAVSAPDTAYTNTLNPHTAIGVSQDKKTVFLAVVDGRQTDYSEGMYTTELASVMKQFGAWDAINVDGGGSSAMVMDLTNDGKKNARVISSPSDNSSTSSPGVERSVGSSLAVFANFSTNFTPLPDVPRPQTSGVLATFASPTLLDTFEGTAGHFDTTPSYSGSNDNISSSSKLVVDTAFHQQGTSSLRLDLVNTKQSPSATQLRLLSGGGTPSNNVIANQAMGNGGFVGFFLRMEPGSSPLYVTVMLDDGTLNSNGMERGEFFKVIADGQYHLYQWDLSEDGKWTNFFNGNGVIDGPNVFLDSIYFASTPSTSGGPNVDATVWIDTVAYNPSGRLDYLATPEPGSMAALAMLGGFWCSRRRRRTSR